ncbi:NAD-dependent epimerase/dehydratase family protein [Phycobacter azelaicus]|uniref:NAD-dependent epimerase/dehydratase family protein n=1 Tax=Phycobacter azelaicus TaxID=2668075 RepID=UPI0018670413|nr:NAD(P)-dependent oxidoreductase [Phycobacter azelaicus]MBE1294804.1 NAD-dependent epimerase/dehydratase family protein [Paracoccaceae bacterium]
MSVVAVTGASGFIGRYLCPSLETAGHSVRPLSRQETDYTADSLARVLEGVDAVVHLAGRRMTREDAPMDLGPFYGPNVGVIGDLVQAAQAVGVNRIVLASTIAIYSSASGLPYRETADTAPINAYALSKLMAEQYLEMLTRGTDVSAIALRIAAVYGAGEKGTPALMKFVNLAQNGQQITLTGNPNYVIDQIYVRDVVEAIEAALASHAQGTINIGGGQPWRVAEIAETANRIFGNPQPVALKTDSDAPMPQTVMALDRAKAVLGWQPRYSLETGITDFKTTLNTTSSELGA